MIRKPVCDRRPRFVTQRQAITYWQRIISPQLSQLMAMVLFPPDQRGVDVDGMQKPVAVDPANKPLPSGVYLIVLAVAGVSEYICAGAGAVDLHGLLQAQQGGRRVVVAATRPPTDPPAKSVGPGHGPPLAPEDLEVEAVRRTRPNEK